MENERLHLLPGSSTGRTPDAAMSLTSRRGVALLLLMCGAQFMVVIDETVVNVSLASIARDLTMTQSQLAWVVNAYLLMFGGFLLLAGRLADLVGRRRLFLAGLALFTGASLAAGFATDRYTLIAARAAQGLGGAVLSPAALSILTTTFRDPLSRRRAMAAWGALLGLGATAGVLLGGVIVEYATWHWAFWVNGPVGLLLAIGCLRMVPPSRGAGAGRVDIPGAVLITTALLLLVYTVMGTDERSWGSRPTLLGLGGAAVLIACFVLWERRAVDPLVPADVLTRRPAVAYLVAVPAASALFGMFFFLTLYMQVVHGWSALSSGLAWAPQGATLALVSGLAIRLVPRFGVRALAVVGLAVSGCAQLLLLRLDATSPYLTGLLPALLVNAVGLGLGLVPVAVVAVHGLPDDRQGLASGLFTTAQQLGGAVGLGVLVSIAAHRFQQELAGGALPGAGYVAAFHVVFVVGSGFLLLASLIATLLPALREKVDLSRL